ncbi:MAG: DUF4344 domain-containing metallopeptidase [Bacteroidia bacterium]|nr:DUF4344 domain-containing metallopeptidase [Bacteroidia bacterium]
MIIFFLIKMEIIRPVEWFVDSPTVQTQTIEGGFLLLTSLNRTQDGFYVSRAGEVVRNAGLLKELINNLNLAIELPQNISILVKPCGEVDAHYDPAEAQILFCDEFFYEEEQLFSLYYQDQAQFTDAVLGATAFTLFHEIGHALIDQLKLPVLGREEDAADQIATYLLVMSGASEQAFHGGEFFAYLAENYQPGHSFPYWDEHGLNEQRFFNITCWLYGYDPGRYAFLVANQVLPLDRAQRCPSESAQSAETMKQLLGPYLRE